MKSLKQIREAKSGGKEAYQKFFNSLLKKYGVKSPSELDDKVEQAPTKQLNNAIAKYSIFIILKFKVSDWYN